MAVWNTTLDIGVFWQWAIIGGVVVEPYFKGIQPVKHCFGDIGPLTDVKSIRYEDICRWHRIFGSIYDGVYMSSIGDSWTDKVTKKYFFSTNNTFHLIIMMISVVLCKINEEINYVSIFHNHVVRIWLCNRPAELSWNRNKNSKLQMLCLEYIVWWYGQFVTNWYHFIEMPFHSTKLSLWRMAKSLVIWVLRVRWQSTKYGAAVEVLENTWRHIHGFIGRNTIALRVQRFAAGANLICLTYATDWWAVIGPVIHDESTSQATR